MGFACYHSIASPTLSQRGSLGRRLKTGCGALQSQSQAESPSSCSRTRRFRPRILPSQTLSRECEPEGGFVQNPISEDNWLGPTHGEASRATSLADTPTKQPLTIEGQQEWLVSGIQSPINCH